MGGGGEGGTGEEADGFGHGGLEGATVGGVGEAVGGKGLAESEEGGGDPGALQLDCGNGRMKMGEILVFEADVMAGKGPTGIAWVPVVAERKRSPYQWVIDASSAIAQQAQWFGRS